MSVCYQVEVSATDRSLVERSTTDCGVCVMYKPQELGGSGQRWAVAREKKNIMLTCGVTYPNRILTNAII